MAPWAVICFSNLDFGFCCLWAGDYSLWLNGPSQLCDLDAGSGLIRRKTIGPSSSVKFVVSGSSSIESQAEQDLCPIHLLLKIL